MSVFSADMLRSLYESFFYDTMRQPRPAKKTRKADMAEAFIKLANNPQDSRLFVDSLAPETYQAYRLLLWDDQIATDKLEEALGFAVTSSNTGTSRNRDSWQMNHYEVHPDFPFIALFLNTDSYEYFSRHDLDTKDFWCRMPTAIRKWLKPHFPKPQGYEIEPLSAEDLKALNASTFNAAPTITDDLAQLADFLTRGTVTRTKKGDFNKASIRKADSLTKSGEWYPTETGKSPLTLMRHEMLLNFIDRFGSATLKAITPPEVSATAFKRILKELKQDEDMLSKWLLGHLQHRYKYYEETFNDDAIERLFDHFKRLPINAWVSTANLKSVQYHQDIDTLFYSPERYTFLTRTITKTFTYEDKRELTPRHQQAVGIDPLIDGVAFILSAFGFVELAYQPPANDAYRTEKHPYLTRFDGALAVRLTEIGAYALGLTSKLTLKQSTRKTASLHLHPEQLHLTCSDLDSITELTLNDYMECVAPEFYRMTRATLLKGCHSPKQVRLRIATFRQRMPVELPNNWNQFLETLINEKSALKKESGLSIFSLANRPDLQRHFTQDPLLRAHSLRVEGHRIAIDLKDLTKVRAHLRKLGYLVES